MRKVSRAEIKRLVSDALAMVGLAGLDARRPRQLSGGQQQRVALARALIYRPPILLMDEPLGALDKNLRQQMQIEIKTLQTELGLTVVYVTHDQAEALAMSDAIAVIEGGRIAQVGPPRALYDHPASRFVATFLGEANLFAGVMSTLGGGAEAATAEGPAGLRATGPAPGLHVGSPVTLIVRPEDVHLADDPDGAGLLATVEAVAFVGDSFRVQLMDEAGIQVLAKLPKAASDPPQVGSRVRLSWDPAKATFVAAQADVDGADRISAT
jgi:ABC-type Fe3+/spermidine/putrescine transport system ATPase subunit